MNKFEVNVALYNLIKGEDLENSAKTVIEFGSKIPNMSAIAIEISIRNKNEETISGQTSAGNVTIKEDVSKDWEYSYGEHKVRIGHFKMWRLDNEIWFHHFWKSDKNTQGEESDVVEFCLEYDEDTLELKHFGYEYETEIFSFWFLHVYAVYIEPLWSKCEKKYVGWSCGI